MSEEYLNKTGLTYFWSKIKAWCNSLFALDSAVVHKTGNESISGTKTFSNQIVGTIGKSVGDGGYADMVQTFQSDNNSYRSCTIRCTNGDGFNEIVLGVHDEVNSAPRGLALKNTAGMLTGEFNGSLRLTRTTDAAGTEDKSPALSIGSISGEHLELDGNEIMAKSSATTTGTLFINREGGDVYIGGYTENYKSVTGRGKGSSTVPVYTDANGIVTACGSSLGVDISGNAATATKLATARTLWGNSFDGSASVSGTLHSVPSIEFKPTSSTSNNGGYLDFHYNQSTSNYTSRIIESASGTLSINNVTITTGKVVTATTFTGALSGNASTATKLETARTINGVSFDGSANITVADSTKVAKAGDTMTGNLTISKASPHLETKNTSITRGISPSSDTNVTEILGKDSADKPTWALYHRYATNKANRISLICYNGLTTDNTYAEIGIGYDSDGNPYTYAPTPSSTTDSTAKIATTRWVRIATGDFACNAATATAFASSKAVTLTGAVTGEASSTGGWSVSTVWRSCIVGRTDNSTSNPWYKVASRKLNGGSSTYNITFYVENANTANKSFGILRASVGTNSDKTINAGVTKFAWLVNDGFAEEDFVLVCPATAEPTVELWTKIATGYLCRRFVVVSEGGNASTGILWTLFDNVSAGQEASIPTEGTQVASAVSELYGSIVPSSRGVVVKRSGTSSLTAFYGGTESYNGGKLELYGGTRSTNPGSFALTASIDSSTVTQLLGKPDGTLIWGGQAIQTSSDERLKTPLSSVPDAVLDAWEAVQWGQFQYLDAVERKGALARLHLGLIAQRVKSVFEERSLDACAYGILCYDKDEDMWTVRYAEALAMEAAYLRRENARLKKRVSDLEDRLAALELRLGSA